MLVWDDDKSQINIEKHGLDFTSAKTFAWHDAVLFDRSRADDGEKRYAAVGMLDGRLHTVIFTRRSKKTRIISLRRSNPSEEIAYEENS